MTRLFNILLFCTIFGALSAQTLPSVTLRDINGKSQDMSKLSNAGKPIVISFFATWCKPCMRELKAINDVYDDWQEETGVNVILVSIDDAQNQQKVRPLVLGQGWDFDVYLDPNGELKRLLQVQNIPHLFLLDGDGKIVYTHIGYTDGGEAELYEQILMVAKH